MSYWLKSVNTLLEKLDDTAGTVAAERTEVQHDENAGDIHDIIAKRGLGANLQEDDDDDDVEEREDGGIKGDEDVESGWQDSSLNFGDDNISLEDHSPEVGPVEQTPEKKDRILEPILHQDPNGESVEFNGPALLSNPSSSGNELYSKGEESKGDIENEMYVAINTETTPLPHKQDAKLPSNEETQNDNSNAIFSGNNTEVLQDRAEVFVSAASKSDHGTRHMSSPHTSAKKAAPPPPPKSTLIPKSQKDAISEAKEAQKEVRTLRRHVVTLNAQLEAAESELQAQRKELVIAAERMEKDRKKAKEEKEVVQKNHLQELAALKIQHQQLLKEQQTKFEEQIAGLKATLDQLEDRRKQEGGTMNKEMAQLEEREKEMANRIIIMEEEKSILLSQIATLQGQQTALGSRLESLTQAADNAMIREREAEDRLDSVLTQHARQISQRQTREAELEKTISELNAALVVAKSVSEAKLDISEKTGLTIDNSFQLKVEALRQDLETANSHLLLERERSEALHQQLREMSRESTHSASAVHAKQIQYERQIADMSLTISKLETRLRENHNKESLDSNNLETNLDFENSKAEQISVLSEEVFRLRDKIASQNSESLAMKSRLQSAIERAEKAEEDLAMVRTGRNNDPDSFGLGISSTTLDRRRRRGTNQSSSIRSVMQLDAGQGERREQLGKVVDVVDSFAVTTGKYLRRNALARAGFIFYLLLIHLWTLILLFVHAHNFEEHTEFSAPHGPHTLLKKASQVSQTDPAPAKP